VGQLVNWGSTGDHLYFSVVYGFENFKFLGQRIV